MPIGGPYDSYNNFQCSFVSKQCIWNCHYALRYVLLKVIDIGICRRISFYVNIFDCWVA